MEGSAVGYQGAYQSGIEDEEPRAVQAEVITHDYLLPQGQSLRHPNLSHLANSVTRQGLRQRLGELFY